MSQRYTLNKNKYLLPPEVDRLRYLLRSITNAAERDLLLIEVALRTGARASEILSLRPSDLNEYDQSIFFRGSKNSNDRELPVQASIFKRLSSLAMISHSEKIFPISYDRLYQIWLLYRPVPKTFHCLRHTFAIELYSRTKDIRLVQVALGHRNIANTMIYADYLYSQQELKKLLL